MNTTNIVNKARVNGTPRGRQSGFFDFGLGLGLFLLFGGTAAVITANEQKNQTEDIAVIQDQPVQQEMLAYGDIDTDC